VSDNPAESRYEAEVDGEFAGFAAYQLNDKLIAFTHTEVLPAFEGKGVGGAIARFAMDDVRARHLRAVPICPFVKTWLQRHPDYADVTGGQRDPE